MTNFNLQITEEKEEHAYEKYVRGVWVSFSPDVIGHFYNVDEGSEAPTIINWNDVARVIYSIDNHKLWPQSNVVRHGDMSDELRLLHTFMASNITLTIRLTEIYLSRTTMLYQLATGHDLKFKEHIFNTNTDLASNPKSRSKIIFLGLISTLCKQSKRLAAELEEKDEEESPANVDEPVESDTPILSQSIRRRGRLNFGPVLDSIQAILQTHTSELQRQEELIATLRSMGEGQRGDHHELLAMFGRLNQHHFPLLHFDAS
ncbi:hypothetical protein Adt_38697 [Abeliophyllum distichum]|uniref:Putative plant transposon protein domain-containing protein n=1 Tax=Abeliophyllum distichum TaxID=126358 RepID=A0ABD1Q748_9LAMI